jgi:hypothetical protein
VADVLGVQPRGGAVLPGPRVSGVGRATKDRGGGLVEELLTFERRLAPHREAERGTAPAPARDVGSGSS